MTREIKFRARVKWNGNHYESGQWVYGHYAYFDGQHQIFDDQENYVAGFGDFTRYDWVEIDLESLGQYTGLKDKNGVEIYEGDILAIVRCSQDHTSCTCRQGIDIHFPSEVTFYRGAFCAENLEGDISRYRIVGNIYENPELLNA